jgi:hypothetical protein
MIEIKKILFPVDLTENASKILPYVLSVSEKYDRIRGNTQTTQTAS